MISVAIAVLEGQMSMLRSVLQSVLAADVDEVICVTDDLKSARRDIDVADPRLFWFLNTAASRSQSRSLAAALWASDPQTAGILFIAADQPGICPELISSILEKFKTSGAWIVTASCAGQPRSPVLYRRDIFPELLKLSGDDIGRSLLEKYSERSALVSWPHDLCC